MNHLSLYILAFLFLLIQAAAAPAFQSPVPPAQEETSKKQGQENQTPNTQEKKKKKAPQPINVTWNQYLSDYEPTYRQNLGPLFTPPRLMKKYENKQVTWTGVYKADLGKEDSAAPLIAMKARTIPVKDMFGSVQNISIAYLLATVDDSAQVSKWKLLTPGESIRFRVTLNGLGFMMPESLLHHNLRDGLPLNPRIDEVKAVLVNDARLVTSKSTKPGIRR